MALDQVTEAKVRYYVANHPALLQQVYKDVPGIRHFRFDSVDQPDPKAALDQMQFAALQRIEELYRPRLQELVCVRLRYCERKDSDLLDLALVLTNAALVHGFPVYTAAILALKAGVLNIWCDCANKKR